jgi:hypothetical protein
MQVGLFSMSSIDSEPPTQYVVFSDKLQLLIGWSSLFVNNDSDRKACGNLKKTFHVDALLDRRGVGVDC